MMTWVLASVLLVDVLPPLTEERVTEWVRVLAAVVSLVLAALFGWMAVRIRSHTTRRTPFGDAIVRFKVGLTPFFLFLGLATANRVGIDFDLWRDRFWVRFPLLMAWTAAGVAMLVIGPAFGIALVRAQEAAAEDDTDGKLFVIADAKGTIVAAPGASEAMLGWPAGSLKGQPLTTIIPNKFHGLHRNGFRHWQATSEGPIFGKTLRVPVVKHDGTETVVCLSIVPSDGVGGRQAVATLIPGDQCPNVDIDLTEA